MTTCVKMVHCTTYQECWPHHALMSVFCVLATFAALGRLTTWSPTLTSVAVWQCVSHLTCHTASATPETIARIPQTQIEMSSKGFKVEFKINIVRLGKCGDSTVWPRISGVFPNILRVPGVVLRKSVEMRKEGILHTAASLASTLLHFRISIVSSFLGRDWKVAGREYL